MQTLTNIVLDLHKPNYVRVTAKQYNDKSRIINVQVTDYGNLITLPEDMIARVKWHKPDGKGVFNDCDIYDNVIRIELTAEMLAAAGTAMAELILYQQESAVSTMAFSVEIYKSVVQDKDIISSDEFRALSNALISVDKCVRSCKENTEQLLEVQLSIEEDRENMYKLAEEINAKTSSDDFNEHVSDSNVHVTEEEKERWNTASADISEASVKYAENAGTSELCTGNAATATALTANAGSATQPVYFSGGKPVACTSYANASVKYATNAGSATDNTKLPLTGGTIEGYLSVHGDVLVNDISSRDDIESQNGDIVARNGNVEAKNNVSAGNDLIGKNGLGESYTAVISGSSNRITLKWTGSQLDVYIDTVRIGRLVTT